MKIEPTSEETVTGCPMCGQESSLHLSNVGAFQKKPENPSAQQKLSFGADAIRRAS